MNKSISVDPAKTNRASSIPVGQGPRGLATNKSGSRLYVVNYISGDVSVVDIQKKELIATIKVGEFPQRIVLSPDEKRAYVSGFGYKSVSVIDLENHRHLRDITVGAHPLAIAVSPDGKFVYTLIADKRQLAIISTDTDQANYLWATTIQCRDLGLSPDGAHLYVSGLRKYGPHESWTEHALTVLDTQTFETVKTIPTTDPLWWVSVNPDGKEVYVSEESRNLAAIDTREFNLTPIETSPRYTEGSLAFANGFAYMVDFSSKTVAVIDTTSHAVVQVLPIAEADSPWNIAYGTTGHLYVSDYSTHSVHIIEL